MKGYYKYIIVAMLFQQIFLISCTNSYKHESFVGTWSEANDSIVLDLRSDSTFTMMIKPTTTSTINQRADTLLSISGTWYIEKKLINHSLGDIFSVPFIRITYRDDYTNFLDEDEFEIKNMFFFTELLYWKQGMSDFFILKRKN